MTPKEQAQNEAIKTLLKQAIMNNPNFSLIQKQQACENLDNAAQQADWIVEMMRACGYLR